jgi:hypothetical protein
MQPAYNKYKKQLKIMYKVKCLAGIYKNRQVNRTIIINLIYAITSIIKEVHTLEEWSKSGVVFLNLKIYIDKKSK